MERAQATVQRTGGSCASKVTLLPLLANGWQTGPFCPLGYVRRSEDRFCEPWSPRLDHQRCWMTQLRPSWQRPVAQGARSPGIMDIALVLRDCGLRRSEAMALVWSDTSGAGTTAAAVCSSRGAQPTRPAWASSWPTYHPLGGPTSCSPANTGSQSVDSSLSVRFRPIPESTPTTASNPSSAALRREYRRAAQPATTQFRAPTGKMPGGLGL